MNKRKNMAFLLIVFLAVTLSLNVIASESIEGWAERQKGKAYLDAMKNSYNYARTTEAFKELDDGYKKSNKEWYDSKIKEYNNAKNNDERKALFEDIKKNLIEQKFGDPDEYKSISDELTKNIKEIELKNKMLSAEIGNGNLITQKLEGNVFKYTIEKNDVVTYVEIALDTNNEIESKTYIKKLENGKTRKTVIIPQTKTTTKWIDGIVDYISIGSREIYINEELGISTASFKNGILTAELKDGSQGTLTEDGTMFTYDREEGENTFHTLRTLDGGGTLEFYNKDTEEGNKDGTITITRGGAKLTFYGTFDGKEVKEKGKKVMAIDENGNILTDFDKNDKHQTIYYAGDVFNAYVFGKPQKDGSEKIYGVGYTPFAFKPKKGETVFIKVDKDGNYVYTNIKGEILNENIARVKEAKAMVTKSLIGPAFSTAANAARGGIALSNLLNSWLDIDFITNFSQKPFLEG